METPDQARDTGSRSRTRQADKELLIDRANLGIEPCQAQSGASHVDKGDGPTNLVEGVQ